MKKDWVNPNPTGSELDAKLSQAGIGRSTFFKRRKAGASVEDALRPPETPGPGKSTLKPGYEMAVREAVRYGLYDSNDDVPSLVHFSRNMDRGLPPELAILARTRWTPEQMKVLQADANLAALKTRQFFTLVIAPEFRQYIQLLFQYANCLTPEQFYTIALMLVKMMNNKGQNDKPAKPDRGNKTRRKKD